jgi:hypothetical protein
VSDNNGWLSNEVLRVGEEQMAGFARVKEEKRHTAFQIGGCIGGFHGFSKEGGPQTGECRCAEVTKVIASCHVSP